MYDLRSTNWKFEVQITKFYRVSRIPDRASRIPYPISIQRHQLPYITPPLAQPGVDEGEDLGRGVVEVVPQTEGAYLFLLIGGDEAGEDAAEFRFIFDGEQAIVEEYPRQDGTVGD